MKFGDIATGIISRFDEKGRGVFDTPKGNGGTRPMLVPFTTIGDEIEVTCMKREKGFSVGKLTKLISPGPSRITPQNETELLHPGMLWNHIRYEDQLLFKKEMINAALEKNDHAERIESVTPCPNNHPKSPSPIYYRNRMDYVFGWQGELGLKEYGSWNRYLDLKDDQLLSPESAQILEIFRNFMKAFPDIKPWDAKYHRGDLRYVVIREGKNTNERLVALVIKDLQAITTEMRTWITSHISNLATQIILSENALLTDLSFGQKFDCLKGTESFTEKIQNTVYQIHLNSFFQTNSIMAEKLQELVAEMVLENNPAQLLDLYCGLGFFGINLAMRNKTLHVSGYEIDAEAIELAKKNAERNSVQEQCVFESGKAEDLSWKNLSADTIIVDPPRAGLHPRVIETLLEKKAKTLIYVSCNYHNFVKELTLLKTHYRVSRIEALDLFPSTPHVEVVTKLELA